MTASKGLGRGLNAFFNDAEEVKEITKPKQEVTGKVVTLKIEELEPMENQPRKVFSAVKLQELADSIKEHGIIQPILVVKKDNGKYSIVAGERRYRAAKIVGLTEVPVIVKQYTEKKKKQIALIENIQREDLNIMEVANALKELIDLEGYKVSDVAKVTGKSSSGISNTLRLLKLPESIQKEVIDGKLVEGQARAILSLDSEKDQLKMAEKIIKEGLTVRQVEKIIYNESNKNIKTKSTSNKKSMIEKEIEDKITLYFGYKTKIESKNKKKKIIIDCINDDGLESILQKLKIKL